MSVPIVAYLSPLLIGLLIPLIVLPGAPKLKAYLVRTGILALSITVIIGGLNWLSGQGAFRLGVTAFLWLAVFLIAWSFMVSGFVYLLAALRLNSALAQVITYAAVLIMNGRIFWANPLIETFASDAGIRQFIIKALVYTTPFLTIAGNFFYNDLLRGTRMYAISVIGPYYSYSYADWRIVALIYCLIGFICYAVGYYRTRKADAV